MFPNTQISVRMLNSGGYSQPSDNGSAIIQTSKTAFFHVYSLRSPPGPGDDTQLASPLDLPEQPLAVSAACGNVAPADAAELTAARYGTEPLRPERYGRVEDHRGQF